MVFGQVHRAICLVTSLTLPSSILTTLFQLRKNLLKWNLSQISDCEFCLLPEKLLHVVAGCKVYLDQGRYTWHHNSALNFLATSFQAINGSSLYADLPGFLSPSIITGDHLRPDLLLKTKENCLYVLELTIGFETNLNCNAVRKSEKYATLVSDLKRQFKSVLLSIFPSVHLVFLVTPAAHSSTCVTLCPLIINRNAISSPNLQASPFAPHTIYSAVETKLGLIQSYSPFNMFFFLSSLLLLFPLLLLLLLLLF